MAATLYESVGGKTTILSAVNSFYRRVLADESLAPFFNTVDTEALSARQGMFLTMLLGGPRLETGEHIRKAHESSRALGLNEAHFDAMLVHFREAMEEVGVRSESLNRIMKLLEGTRDAVLGR